VSFYKESQAGTVTFGVYKKFRTHCNFFHYQPDDDDDDNDDNNKNKPDIIIIINMTGNNI